MHYIFGNFHGERKSLISILFASSLLVNLSVFGSHFKSSPVIIAISPINAALIDRCPISAGATVSFLDFTLLAPPDSNRDEIGVKLDKVEYKTM